MKNKNKIKRDQIAWWIFLGQMIIASLMVLFDFGKQAIAIAWYVIMISSIAYLIFLVINDKQDRKW